MATGETRPSALWVPVFKDGKYSNPESLFGKTVKDLVYHWLTTWNGKLPKNLDAEVPVFRPDFRRRGYIRMTWLGHATCLVDARGKVGLFDPVFDTPIGPRFWQIKRYRPSPCKIEELPRVDYVCITHDHFDHLNPGDIEKLYRAQRHIRWYVPIGLKKILTDLRIPAERIVELSWGESHVQEDGVSIHCVPAVHWSGRGPVRNTTLWCGWVVQYDGTCVYHAGDTGYSPVFKEIGQRFQIDLAMIPIGHCEPRDWMKHHHIDPSDAINVFKDIGARYAVGIHHLTFFLSSSENPVGPRNELRGAGIPNFQPIDHGNSLDIPERTARETDVEFWSIPPNE